MIQLPENGNFHRIAINQPETYQAQISRGLLGLPFRLSTNYKNLPDQWRLLLSGAHWIRGESSKAIRIISSCEQTCTAAALNKLYHEPAPGILLQSARIDTIKDSLKSQFNLHEIRYPKPYSTLRELLPKRFDNYRTIPFVSQNLEWHYPPFNDIPEKVVSIAQTADFDYHFQSIYSSLSAFDILSVTDSSEHSELTAACNDKTIITLPHPFAPVLPGDIPSYDLTDRDIDIFVSGTQFQPYHPDKARINLEMLRDTNYNVLVTHGHLDFPLYQALLARSKYTLCHYRRTGGYVTRALDGALEGVIPILYKDNVTALHLEKAPIAIYDPEKETICELADRLMGSYRHTDHAKMRSVAHSANRHSYQYYLRACQFWACYYSSTTSERKLPATFDLRQRNFNTGWTPPRKYRISLVKQTQAYLQRLTKEAVDQPNLTYKYELLAIREKVMLLHNHFNPNTPTSSEQISSIHKDLVDLLSKYPDHLNTYLYLARVCLYLGSDSVAKSSFNLITERLKKTDKLTLDCEADFLPHDFLPEFFDYRSVCDLLAKRHTPVDSLESTLQDHVLSSIYLHLWLYTKEPAFISKSIEYSNLLPFSCLEFVRNRLNSSSVNHNVVSLLQYLLTSTHLFYPTAKLILANHSLLADKLPAYTFTTALKHLTQIGTQLFIAEDCLSINTVSSLSEHYPVIRQSNEFTLVVLQPFLNYPCNPSTAVTDTSDRLIDLSAGISFLDPLVEEPAHLDAYTLCSYIVQQNASHVLINLSNSLSYNKSHLDAVTSACNQRLETNHSPLSPLFMCLVNHEFVHLPINIFIDITRSMGYLCNPELYPSLFDWQRFLDILSQYEVPLPLYYSSSHHIFSTSRYQNVSNKLAAARTLINPQSYEPNYYHRPHITKLNPPLRCITPGHITPEQSSVFTPLHLRIRTKAIIKLKGLVNNHMPPAFLPILHDRYRQLSLFYRRSTQK